MSERERDDILYVYVYMFVCVSGVLEGSLCVSVGGALW